MVGAEKFQALTVHLGVSRRVVLGGFAAVLAGLGADVSAVHAEWTPQKPITIIVPYPPGGTSDRVARLLAQGMSKDLGQSVIVENKPGANGITGTQAIAGAEPDGYTIGIVSSSHASTAALLPSLPFDPAGDFTGITPTMRVGTALVVNPGFEAKTIQELIALAKANPGKYAFGTAGNGQSSHFAGEAMKLAAKVDMTHVPYKGGAPGLSDVIAGQIPMMYNAVSSVMPSIEAGKVRPLVVSLEKRLPQLPDVPTMIEVGIATDPVYEWYGIVGPAKMPAEAVKTLNVALIKQLKDPAFADPMTAQGIEVVTSTPEEFDAFVRSEIVRFKELVAAANIKIE